MIILNLTETFTNHVGLLAHYLINKPNFGNYYLLVNGLPLISSPGMGGLLPY